MKSFSLFTSLLLTIGAQSQGTTTVGSSGDCTRLISSNLDKISGVCGGFNTPSNATIPALLNSIPAVVSSLDQVCAPACVSALSSLADDYSSSACGSTIIDTNSGINGSIIGSVYDILNAIICTKVDNEYCLVSEVPTLLPLLENVNQAQPENIISSLAPLAANTTFLCSACFLTQIKAVSQIENVDASIASYLPLLSNLTSACAESTTSTTPRNSALITAGSATGIALAALILAIF